MNKLPETFDARVFVGRTLEMICINANQVYLHFNDNVMICADDSFGFEKSDKTFSVVKIPPVQCDILQLLEHKVAQAHAKKGDVLIVVFDNGASLRFDPLPGYESYRIVISGKEIII